MGHFSLLFCLCSYFVICAEFRVGCRGGDGKLGVAGCAGRWRRRPAALCHDRRLPTPPRSSATVLLPVAMHLHTQRSDYEVSTTLRFESRRAGWGGSSAGVVPASQTRCPPAVRPPISDFAARRSMVAPRMRNGRLCRRRRFAAEGAERGRGRSSHAMTDGPWDLKIGIIIFCWRLMVLSKRINDHEADVAKLMPTLMMMIWALGRRNKAVIWRP